MKERIKNYPKYYLKESGMKVPQIESRKTRQEGTIVQVRAVNDLDQGRGMEKTRF